MNCFRYLGYTSLYDIEVTTLYEYQMRMRAHRLTRIDKEYDMHMQAWLNHLVTATKEQGKKHVPVYKDFKSFFDYKKALASVEDDSSKKRLTNKQRLLAKAAAFINQKGGI